VGGDAQGGREGAHRWEAEARLEDTGVDLSGDRLLDLLEGRHGAGGVDDDGELGHGWSSGRRWQPLPPDPLAALAGLAAYDLPLAQVELGVEGIALGLGVDLGDDLVGGPRQGEGVDLSAAGH